MCCTRKAPGPAPPPMTAPGIEEWGLRGLSPKLSQGAPRKEPHREAVLNGRAQAAWSTEQRGRAPAGGAGQGSLLTTATPSARSDGTFHT